MMTERSGSAATGLAPGASGLACFRAHFFFNFRPREVSGRRLSRVRPPPWRRGTGPISGIAKDGSRIGGFSGRSDRDIAACRPGHSSPSKRAGFVRARRASFPPTDGSDEGAFRFCPFPEGRGGGSEFSPKKVSLGWYGDSAYHQPSTCTSLLDRWRTPASLYAVHYLGLTSLKLIPASAGEFQLTIFPVPFSGW